MTSEPAGAAEILRNVLKMWDVVPDDVSPIGTNGNWHWKVRRGGDRFVVRIYRRERSDTSIQYELDVLERLRAKGWPVAAAADKPVSQSGLIFALFPFLPGRPHLEENDDRRRCRGRILGELHRELSAMAGIGQRTGWQRADEVAQGIELHRLPESNHSLTIALHLEESATASTGQVYLPAQ
jgi:Ser/Thr protein kinase RdoA (MazF antagonist)